MKLYFGKKEKWVLEVLAGYKVRKWSQLTEELGSLYTLSYEKRAYQPKDMQWLIGKDQKIVKLSHFDTYWRDFLVIMSSLDKLRVLSEFDQDDIFGWVSSLWHFEKLWRES